jgi:signal transduction histidine kinase
MAAGSDGVWREAPPLTLEVVPRLWETWWFRASLGAGLVAGVAFAATGVGRRRLRRQLERLERARAVEQERARIARDIHDDLGSRLTEISLLGSLALRESVPVNAVREDVSRMMRRVHELVSTLDEIVWAVNPRNDSLKHLATYLCHFATEFLESAAIQCRLDVAPELPPCELSSEVRHNIFLATKEALHNAVQHARATKVWLRVKVSAGWLEVEVADDGRGFRPEAVSEGGNGLHNMARRLTECGGRCEVRSAPGSGTTVHLRLPLNLSTTDERR